MQSAAESIAFHRPTEGQIVGLARSLLAAALILTLLLNTSETLFGVRDSQRILAATASPLRPLSFFELLGPSWSEVLRVSAAVLLIPVLVGWRPRITAFLHAWMAWSFQFSCVSVEGGDQISSNIALILVPFLLVDARKWHWCSQVQPIAGRGDAVSLLRILPLFTVRFQAACIYFHAAVGKLTEREWKDGTALHYWFGDPFFGSPASLSPILDPVLRNPYGVTLSTWSVLALEFLLAFSLVMKKAHRIWILPFGLIFHFGIVLVHGLFSFFFAMAALLVLFLITPEGIVQARKSLRIARATSERFFKRSSAHGFSEIR
jgi:antimicrobial peptide system SdpB family protein